MNKTRAHMVILALFSGLSAAACTTSKALPPDEPRATTAPPSTAPVGDPELSLQTETAAPAALAFGAPCKADDVVHCGTKGRVAVMVEMRNGMPSARTGVPCELVNVSQQPVMDEGRGCVKDDRVYLTAGCTTCRQFSEWDMTGIVAEMTDPQILTAQKKVGLAPEPVLRTTEGWRAAIVSAAAKAPKRKR